jgi:fluoride exporter
VLLGGVVGSSARVAVGEMIPTGESGFPTAVLVVNLVGALLLGLFLARRERSTSRPNSLRFWAIGVLGSFTTFSTFTVDLVRLTDAGHLPTAAIYLGASIVGGLLAAMVGLRVGAIIE